MNKCMVLLIAKGKERNFCYFSSSLLLFIPLQMDFCLFSSNYVPIPIVANGPFKAGKGDTRIPEAISTNGYDCNIPSSLEHPIVFHLYVVVLIFFRMILKTEMMSDAIDDALDNDEAEDETEELTNQVHWKSFSFLNKTNI